MTGGEIVRARVTDGPWGPLLGALAARGFTGELSLESGDKRYAIALRRGAVVGASSPLASDAIVRIALTGHLITAVHIATLSRAIAAAPGRDEIDVVAEVAHLSPEQAYTLRARAITQRAARTFAIDDGEVVIRPAASPAGALEIDMAAVIFLGARMNLSEVRLANELRRLGARFVLADGAETLLPRFGFAADGVAIANVLRGGGGPGVSLAELEAAHREIDPRIAAATIYALVSCGAAIATAPGSAAPVVAPAPPEARTRSQQLTAREVPVVTRAPTDLAVPTEDLAVPAATFRTPTHRPSSPAVARTMTPRWSPDELAAVIASRLALIDQGADYFSLLGLVIDAPIEAVRVAHSSLTRALQHAPAEHAAATARLQEHVAAAASVLTDPSRRMAYVAALRRGGDVLVGIPRTRTEEERSPVDEAVHRAMLALRSDQPQRAAVELVRACELEPGNVDHAVLLAWARFCAATDKGAVAAETRKVLTGAARQSDRPQLAWFYLGRVERMLGRDREALAHFHAALELDPANLEAAAEVRVLEARSRARR